MGLFGTDIGPDIKIGGGDNGLLGQVGEGIQRPFSEIGKALGIVPSGSAFNAPPPSAQLVDALHAYQDPTGKSPTDIQNKLMSGVDGAAKDVGFDPTSASLTNRSRNAFEKGAGDLGRQAEFAGTMKSLQQKGSMVDAAQQLYNYQRGVDYKVNTAQANLDATRSEVMGSLFGSIGKGVGTYAAQSSMKNMSPLPTPAVSSGGFGFGGGSSVPQTYNSPSFGTIGGE